jgi:hypothetical protein
VAGLAEGTGWKEVRVVDGAQLKQWLASAPGVAARWATWAFGAYPPGVRSTDEFWKDYASRFSVPVSEELVLAGRAEQARQVVERLAALQPDRIEVSADSPDEALAFVVAALRRAQPEVRAVVEARSLVLETAEAVVDLARRGVAERGMAFFPTLQAAHKAGLLTQHGPTVIAHGRVQPRGSSCIQLLPPPRHVFAEALAASGHLDRPRAAQLAAGCGRSVTVLARLVPGGSFDRPAWAEGPERSDLVPALLAGGWDAGNEADRRALAAIAGVAAYEEWEARVEHLCSADDPPLEHAGGVWKVRAPVDAFVLLGRFVSGVHLARFRQVCLDVLAERDANLDLDEAALRLAGRGLRRSHWLREGLAATLLLAATMHGPASFGASLSSTGSPEAWVSRIVADLPGLGSDVRLMASLQGALPLLAEAAPGPFAAAVASLLDGGADAVAPLFRERTAFLTPDARHTHLLWALEALAWDPDLLPRTAVLLARLASVDPGGKLANRPIASLREILLPWLPHTDADLDRRLAVLAAVVRTDERVGWGLCLRLLPETHGISTPTSRPRLREAGAREGRPPGREVAAACRSAAEHALWLVGRDVDRWLALVERVPDLPPESHAGVVERLDDMLSSAGPADRHRLWKALRDMTARHAGFPDTDWAMRGEPLARLTALVRRWTPDDPVARAVPLFDELLPELAIAPDEGPATAEELERRRVDALRKVLAAEGVAGVVRLAEALTNGWEVTRLTAEIVPSAEQALDLCRAALAGGSEAARSLAPGLSRTAYAKFGEEWRRRLAGVAGDLAPADAALLLLGLPDELSTWELVNALGSGVEDAFWARFNPWFPSGTDPLVLECATKRLLKAGRAAAALVVIKNAKAVPADLAFAALDAAVAEINAAEGAIGGSFLYTVERVFEGLADRGDVDPEALATREFAYLPVLTGTGRKKKPLALFRLIAGNPGLFASLISAVFFPAFGERAEPTAAQRRQAQAAFRALEAFRALPGHEGQDVDASVLGAWAKEALRLTAEADRAKIGAQYVGKVLAHAPADPGDGAWPIRAVRDVLEDLNCAEVERGLAVERFNMRGPYWKDPYDGGAAERGFAAQSRQWAAASAAWPRTSAMLCAIAEDWDRHAEHEDTSARLNLMDD